MKTKVSGWINILFSILTAFFVCNSLMYAPDYSSQAIADHATRAGIIILVIAVIFFITSIGMIRHSNWSWYIGLVLSSLILLTNIFYLVARPADWIIYVVFIVISLLTAYSLISDRGLFNSSRKPPPTF